MWSIITVKSLRNSIQSIVYILILAGCFSFAKQNDDGGQNHNPIDDYPLFENAEKFLDFFSNEAQEKPSEAAMQYLEVMRSHWQIVKGVNSKDAVSYVRLLGDWFLRLIIEQHQLGNISDVDCAKYIALVHLGLGEILLKTDEPAMGAAYSLRGAKFYEGTYWGYLLLERVVQQCNQADRPEDAINIAQYQFGQYPQFEYVVEDLTGNNYHMLTLKHLKRSFSKIKDHRKKKEVQDHWLRLKKEKDSMVRYSTEEHESDSDFVVVNRVFEAYGLVSNQ